MMLGILIGLVPVVLWIAIRVWRDERIVRNLHSEVARHEAAFRVAEMGEQSDGQDAPVSDAGTIGP